MTRKKGKAIKVLALVLAVVLVAVLFSLLFREEEAPTILPDLNKALTQMAGISNVVDYDTYIALKDEITDIRESKHFPQNLTVEEGKSQTVYVDVDECMASLELTYRIFSDNNADGSCEIRINGEKPFREMSEMVLKRNWISCEAKADERGNEYTVPLTESTEALKTVFYDASGLHLTPFKFHFKEGKNSITITSNKGNIEITDIALFHYEEVASYQEVKKEYQYSDKQIQSVTLEAEKPYLRTNASITELCDRSSVTTVPAFKGIQCWNSLGGSGWSNAGQSVSFKIDVRENGLYHLGIRYKNNFVSGLSTYRKIRIDGEVPFYEMESVKFPYSTDWQSVKLSDENGTPYLYELEKGEHIITFEVTLGQQAFALNIAQKALSRLNEAYRKIIMVTGASPDQYRDYQIEKNLPDVLDIFKEQTDVLESLSDWLYIQNGGKGEGTAKIDEIVRKLREFNRYPETLPQNLTTFSSSLTGLSDWIQSCTSQPLTLDCIQLLSEKDAPREAKAGFFRNFAHSVELFVRSFSDDYGVIGSINKAEDSVEVWLTLGRDQYQILKELIDNDFTKETNIPINLKLVAGGILQATVAGIAPDVNLFNAEEIPMNFAARGALLDLSKFKNYEQVASRFAPQALVPYTYNGGVYGIPLTQVFDVMFVRDDILKEIGLSVPETWDDIYNCLTVLQQNNMEFAFPESGSLNGFALLLFQNQNNLYKDNGKEVDINTEAGIEAFSKWTKLYSEYSLLMSYNFVNRFRSGDMPIGIASFATFNTLEVSAPEISGLWSMHLVPGTEKDGEVHHIAMSSTTAAMILKTAKSPDNAWKFVDWFTSAQAQYQYGTAIENKQGISGRYSTANIEAFGRLSWSAQTLKTLNLQRETAMSIEQVPGGYFLSRHINNIFRKIVNQGVDVRECVNEYTNTINNELTKKRKEFGLEVDEP